MASKEGKLKKKLTVEREQRFFKNLNKNVLDKGGQEKNEGKIHLSKKNESEKVKKKMIGTREKSSKIRKRR